VTNFFGFRGNFAAKTREELEFGENWNGWSCEELFLKSFKEICIYILRKYEYRCSIPSLKICGAFLDLK
jgi:hypothetical protein